MRTGLRFLAARGLLAAAFFLPAQLAAQGVGRISVLSGAELRTLNFDAGLGIKSVSEFVVPVGVVWPISSRVSVDVGTRYARASRTDEGGASASISGLTDLQARAVVQLVPDVLLLTLGANLPTGKTKLTTEELNVAGAIASDLIPFPVSSFGSGSNFTSGLALAVPLGGWALGLAGSYRVSGNYTPLSDTGATYKAGGETRLRVGLDRLAGQGRVSLGFTYSNFTKDEFADSPIFASGDRYISQASWSFPLGNVGVAVYAWDLYRAAGAVPGSLTTTEKQNIFTFGSAASVQVGRNVLRPSFEFRRHMLGVQTLRPAGTLFSVGAKYQMPLGEKLSLLPAARFDGGKITAADGSSVSYRGFSFSVGLRTAL